MSIVPSIAQAKRPRNDSSRPPRELRPWSARVYSPPSMRVSWWVVLAGCICVVGCSSKSSSPSDGSVSDAPASDVLASDSSSSEVMAEVGCTPTHPPFDGSVPPDASCVSRDDTDHDGVPDCIDGCPYDPNKVAPGVCGCNSVDIDSDGDGVADCADKCPQDPNNTAFGQCGCVGQVGLEPKGGTCNDTPCPGQTDTICNGAGVCGDRAQCSPCPGGHYITSVNYHRYWFCAALPPVTGPSCTTENTGAFPAVTRAAAQTACAAKGLSLVRIQTGDENAFIAGLIASPVWIGANDLDTPGQWYWPSPTSNSDSQIWSGGADGGSPNNFYDNWAKGAPGSATCASISSIDGRWSDTDCNQMHGYICE